jgi:hypothetical protein
MKTDADGALYIDQAGYNEVMDDLIKRGNSLSNIYKVQER